MAIIVRARYEKGVLKPLDELRLREGEEVIVAIRETSAPLVERLWGIARRRRRITREEFLQVLEEVEDEDIRGH